MLKNELIALLQAIPGNPTVTVEGYECGQVTLEENMVAPDVVLKDFYPEDWRGPHAGYRDFYSNWEEKLEKYNSTAGEDAYHIKVIHLARRGMGPIRETHKEAMEAFLKLREYVAE